MDLDDCLDLIDCDLDDSRPAPYWWLLVLLGFVFG